MQTDKNHAEVILALDAGGTFIKYAPVSASLEIEQPVQAEPVPSLGSADEILGAFRRVAETLSAGIAGRRIAAVAVAICGPMDYREGIFRMTEDKYRAVYGIDLKAELRRGFGLPETVPVETIHDVQAFLRGCAVIEPALRHGRFIGITLGTGIGSTFMADSRIIRPGDGIPDRGLGRLPWGNGKLEEYIGGEALRRLYPGGRFTVKELEELAIRGDDRAAGVFRELGEILGRALEPHVAQFRPDAIVLGGQISRAAALFLPELRRFVSIPIRRSADQERAPLLGAAAAVVPRER